MSKRIFLLFFLPILLCSCSQEEVIYPHTLETTTRFSKKIEADLSLECGRVPQNLVSGQSGQKMRFILRNNGLAPVEIDEWYEKESNNVRVFYTVCEKGKSGERKESDWKQGWPLKKGEKKGRHQPVRLNPKTQGIVLDVPMDFLKRLRLTKPVMTIAVYVELDLESVPLRSPVYELDIRPIVREY